jgi:hypothetical protein
MGESSEEKPPKEPTEVHVGIDAKVRTWKLLPLFINSRTGITKIKIKNIGDKEIEKIDFEAEIICDETSPNDKRPNMDSFEIPGKSLKNGKSFKFERGFAPEKTGDHLLHISVKNADKKNKIILHAGNKKFDGDYYRRFQTYSWYHLLAVIGICLTALKFLLEF